MNAQPVWWIAGFSLAAVLIVHYWVLWGASRLAPPNAVNRHGVAMLLVLSLAAAHVVYITAYALLSAGVIAWSPEAGLDGGAPTPANLFTVSAMAFTTLGFSAVTPAGPLRIVTAAAGLAGFMTLTWSATFVYSAFKATWER